MDKGKIQLLITGPSASGKTTLQSELIENYGWVKPTNFTTRKKRAERELDEYVFLTEEQFAKKARNGHFAEFMEYGNNLYGMTRYMDLDKNNAIIVDPVGKAAMEKFFRLNHVRYLTAFVSVPVEIMKRRLADRRLNVTDERNRMDDLLWFHDVNFKYDMTIDGTLPVEETAQLVDQFVKTRQASFK